MEAWVADEDFAVYSCVGAAAPVEELLERLCSVDAECRIEAAREIRWLTKTSSKNRRQLAGAVGQLVSMLQSESQEGAQAAILALLNLAVKDERNKVKIVQAGALYSLCDFMKSSDSTLQEYATTSLLTLSASSLNKTTICAAGAIPLLIMVLTDGTPQAKIDAAAALFNLSTVKENLNSILSSHPIPAIISLLKTIKKSSKTAEKCCALLEFLLSFDEFSTAAALTSVEGGVLTVVEVLEEGSVVSKEHAVGTLLTMCKSDRKRYREVILNEGVIPGLLELTVQGTPTAQAKARELLKLLRESPYPRRELQADTLDNIVYNIVSRIDGDDKMGVTMAKKMLAEMVQVSMEQSLRHLQQRAFVYTPADLPLGSCNSQVSLK
ncbi:U-box domain-containing protein 4-like [Dendrobium catenatum]|uniref:U-box domain-containing protein 4 n=1 Tax=Dendrobium catenatum TaxID=906689 RepID=A0A2I0WFW6_9ASPA|nr:U-box domain-containing protein 4-like [Dendrobium catenatum]PKU74538.1 U-box domain-containing protein 4 [Dendrobium catenatum]